MAKKRIYDLSIEEDESVDEEGMSRTQYKKIHLKVQKFVNALTKLSVNEINGLGLPEEAADVIISCRKMKASGAKNRSLKHAVTVIMNDELWSRADAMEQYDRITKGHRGLIGIK